ncbi:MAG: hypothetical protein LBN39_12275, partial [Planctomycetaceae bacterium]|jgi:hypothetical protein|nr:hypothetical protein [Planctomycetaceae bacterium]
MERHGGFSRLRINNGSYQYYETSNSSVLGAAYGNGFRTPQQRKGAGRNWVIGVRNTVAENNNATVTTSSTVSTPVSTPISATPVTGSTVVATNSVSNQTNNNDDKQNSNESNNGLPVLPNYDD